ncbi:CHAD domain-containing protein [Acinetobacter defluvii]|uniref:CYTH and CHAD domain-containing protein n=1 Tax=Acinetobacter defluvii TaxID=1871111 RepID=UPI003AF5FD61
MLEVELKFQIAPDKQDLLVKTIQRKNFNTLQLNAKYFDTDEFKLSEKQISLRQRLENSDWIQTLKLPTVQQLQRSEFEQDLGEQEPENLDLDIYQKQKDIDKKTLKLFKKIQPDLHIQFETQVERFVTLFNFQKSQIEVSLDIGKITHQDQVTEIFEIEFELKQGTIQDLISFVLPRVKRYGLWLDVRSKAQRGFLLAQNSPENPVAFQTPLTLNADESPEQALKDIINNALQHILPNSTAIASGNFHSEHVHQARVAIRRLRSALKTFSKWSNHLDPTWEEQLAQLFRQLGTTRDFDVIEEELLPQLKMAGAPEFELTSPSHENEIALDSVFKSMQFNNLVLSLIQYVNEKNSEKTKENLKKKFEKDIKKLHQQIVDDAQHYLDLTIDERHRTRKRLKRLRYSIEFISSIYDAEKVKKYLKALKPAQESLGQYNDLIVAEDLFKSMVEHEPKAWFALGWLAARQQLLLEQTSQDLALFSAAKPFW